MLKLKRFKQGEWFDYPGSIGVRLRIRPIQSTTGLELQSKIRTTITREVSSPRNPSRKIPIVLEDVDSNKLAWEIFDYMLEDFEGISMEDEAGQPIVDKAEIKRQLFSVAQVRDFITDKAEGLTEAGVKQWEDETKNLPSSQNG